MQARAHNVTVVAASATARTRPCVAQARAADLAAVGCRVVLEACAGPSLPTLTAAYSTYGVVVVGNDVDPLWTRCPGRWVFGDCLAVDWTEYDAVVLAPPLSRGCTGSREDSLPVASVTPSYDAFVDRLRDHRPRITAVLVLPGRAAATRQDRADAYRLLSRCWGLGPSRLVERKDERARVVKYVEVHVDLS